MDHKVNFAELQGLPRGLSGIYETEFDRMVGSAEKWRAYSQLIGLVVVAREPLPATLAMEVSNAMIKKATST